uniref:Uncharacterized protein n=1 Tax=Arundo donax TaxID=35708 RepID=A0A0A9FG33_ARUDO
MIFLFKMNLQEQPYFISLQFVYCCIFKQSNSSCFLLESQWPIGPVGIVLPLSPHPKSLGLYRDAKLFRKLLLDFVD